MSDVIAKLRLAAQEIRQIQVPDQLTDKTVETFSKILRQLDELHFKLMRFANDPQLLAHREASIRFGAAVRSTSDRERCFFSTLVAVRTICQSATYDFVDPRVINYIARMITRLKNSLLPGLADELKNIADLLGEGTKDTDFYS